MELLLLMHEGSGKIGQWQKKTVKKADLYSLKGKKAWKTTKKAARYSVENNGLRCSSGILVSNGLTLYSYLPDKRAQEEYERLAREAAQTTQETITIEETEKQELETEPGKEEYQSPYDF